jgi:hypothetical protein
MSAEKKEYRSSTRYAETLIVLWISSSNAFSPTKNIIESYTDTTLKSLHPPPPTLLE